MRLLNYSQKSKKDHLYLVKIDLDDAIQKYILSIREADGIINTAIVIAGA